MGSNGVDRHYAVPVVAECHVVLELAGDHAGVATGTTVEIDDKSSLGHY
jgi:hypothetical protein